jgi:PAS domain S-box-containing protein
MDTKQTSAELEKRIAELERLLTQYKNSAIKYQTLFDTFPHGITVTDVQGKVIETNAAAAEMLSISKQDHEKRSIDGPEWQLIRPDGSVMPRQEWPSVIALTENRAVVDREMGILKSQGDITWLNVTAAPLPIPDYGVVVTYSDTTRRKQAEEAHHEEEKRYRRLFDSHLDPVYLLADDGGIIDANTSACEALGRSKENLRSLSIKDVDPNYDSDAFQLFWSEHPEEQTQRFESVHQRADGRLFPVEVTGIPFFDRGKRLLYGFARDITERQIADRALRQSEERYRSLFENAQDAIFIADPDTGTLLDANQKALQLTGYTKEELINKNQTCIHPSEHREMYRDAFYKSVAGQETTVVEMLIQKKTGEHVPVELSSGGSIRLKEQSMHIGIFRDITDRKLAAETLLQSEDIHRSILKSSLDGFWITDTQGQLLEVNDAYCSMSGYKEEELLTMRISDLEAAEDAEMVKQHMQKILSQGHDRFETKQRRKDGSVYDAEVSVQYRPDDDGRLTCFLRDLTASKALQAQIAQAQKMESIGRLTGGVAHDFNNILSVIIGYTEMALETVSPSEPLHGDLEKIFDAAKRSSEIVRQLLAFSRQQTIAPKVIDLNDTITTTLKMLHRLIGEDIELAWMPSLQVASVKMDPSQVDQILANLCVNARDAIKKAAGRVTISTSMAVVDKGECHGNSDCYPGTFVQIKFTDNGSGIPTEYLDKIFEPFFTSKEVGKGTGLGLSTVYGIIKQNKGFINVSTKPGDGTTFIIHIPACETAEEIDSATQPETIQRGQGETILVVEDEPDLLSMTAAILTRLGYHVLTAATPSTALRMVQDHPDKIDLLLTDVVMPEMNGKELAHLLTINRLDLKVVYMSGYTADTIADRGVLPDGLNFIQKPFTQLSLATKIRAVLEG